MRVDNIVVGQPDVRPSVPSHTRGVHEGNRPSKMKHTAGMDMDAGEASARRSTGINPRDREPIDPRSPRLSPP